jgi:hemolysin III
MYYWGEEIANAVTHGVGLLLSCAGLAVLAVYSVLYGSVWHVVACSIYGSTLILLYLSSTLYHAIASPPVKHFFRILDHSSIYLLIAGSYTPFLLVCLRNTLGITLLSILWGLSAAGILFKIFCVGGYEHFSTLLYVAMGWIVVFAVRPMAHALTWRGMAWILAGGLFYTGGVLFYASRRRYFHAIWHICVLLGSVCHYFAILFFVVLR